MGNSNTHSIAQSSYINDIRMTVETASKVIVPLSPISVFAARSPWSGLEDKTFDEVASWLKQERKVDIYPARTTIIEARQQGEISDKYIEQRFQQWIEETKLSIPKAHAIQYGKQALKLRPLKTYSEEQDVIDELVKDLTGSLKESNTASGQFSSVPLISTYVFDDKNEKLIDTLDYHVIKWCKLFIDDAQSGWTMPNRDKGLFNAWQRLVPYDPALTKQQRTRLQSLPNDAESLLKTSLNNLGIKDIEIQTYLENHLLSLPGWAGMMMWQDDHHKKVHDLLFTYLAIRVAMEWAIVEPHLPVTPPDAKDDSVLETSIVSWLQWGGFTVET
ncbi:putative inorganic carbon transporter subunit DabA, partial [Staphylococcus xylosus]